MRKIFLFFLLCFSLSVSAQGHYERYIAQYKDMAIEQMQRYGIPASITLAQGLLESGAGRSELATKANNHFGIKCGGDWKGKYMLKDDDARNEKFRVYRSAEESYEDHSRFLSERERYASLFKLSIADYKGWAHGLKRAGYATNPRYAHNLIDIIERYNLDRYDGKGRKYSAADKVKHEVQMCNDNYYIIARRGDSFKTLGKEMGVRARKLRKYNEVNRHYALEEGDIVYLEKKRKRADCSLRGKVHVVADGESIHRIAQKYGIRMQTLYKKNRLPEDYSAKVGDKLRIR